MTTLADDPRSRKGTGLDWIIISLIVAAIMVILGLAALVWMFSGREYWRSDPTMPAVFLMFSKIINGSTLGVMGVFIGVIIAACAILCLYMRAREQAAIHRHEQLEHDLRTMKQFMIALGRAVAAHTAPRNERQPQDHLVGAYSSMSDFTAYLTAYEDLRSKRDQDEN